MRTRSCTQHGLPMHATAHCGILTRDARRRETRAIAGIAELSRLFRTRGSDRSCRVHLFPPLPIFANVFNDSMRGELGIDHLVIVDAFSSMQSRRPRFPLRHHRLHSALIADWIIRLKRRNNSYQRNEIPQMLNEAWFDAERSQISAKRSNLFFDAALQWNFDLVGEL